MAYAATAEGSLPSMTAAPACSRCSARWCGWSAPPAPSSSSSPAPTKCPRCRHADLLRHRLAAAAGVHAAAAACSCSMSATPSAPFPFLDKSEVANWIATSWYMAVTVIFFAMVMSEDTEARLDMLRRGLIVGAMIAATCRHRRLFQPGSRRPRPADAVRARARHLQGSERARRVPDPAGAVRAAKRRLRPLRQIVPQHDRLRHHVAGDPAGVFARGLGRADRSPRPSCWR